MARGSVETRTSRTGEPSYRARIDVGRNPLTGRRDFKTRTFATKKAAEKWLRDIGKRLDDGTYAEPSRERLTDYLTHWLETRTDLASATVQRYDVCIRRHVAPAIGAIELGKLDGHRIQQLYNQLAGTSQPRIIRTILRQALNQAVAEGLISRNPSIGLKARGSTRAPGDQAAWTVEQLVTFLRAADETRYGPLFAVLASTGLRIGEVLALTWRNVDLEARTISVTQAKTAASRRALSIDQDTVAILKAQRDDQRRRLQLLDVLLTGGTLLFDRGDGERVHRAVVEWQMQRIIERTGLPRLTPHGLRHTHATLLLIARRPVHYVQHRLGHESAATTLRYYAHVLPATDQEDAETFGEIMRRGKTRAS